MKVLESTLTCRRCGERLTCILTGPDTAPNTRATYVCPNDYGYGCQGASREKQSEEGVKLTDTTHPQELPHGITAGLRPGDSRRA